MIVFNGNNITGGNFFNGSNLGERGISGLWTGIPKNFDEWKSEDAGNVERISIDSISFPVNISVSNSSKVEVHLYGQANLDGDIDFDVSVVNRELKIAFKLAGNCYNNNLKLDVTVPHKTFKEISVKSSSAGITLNEGISTDYLKIKTQSGNLETNATFTNATITTSSGDVELYIDANKNISLEIFTSSGDVSAEFNNIGYLNLSTNSSSGDVRNRHKAGTGYTANVDISTSSGDIKIR